MKPPSSNRAEKGSIQESGPSRAIQLFDTPRQVVMKLDNNPAKQTDTSYKLLKCISKSLLL